MLEAAREAVSFARAAGKRGHDLEIRPPVAPVQPSWSRISRSLAKPRPKLPTRLVRQLAAHPLGQHSVCNAKPALSTLISASTSISGIWKTVQEDLHWTDRPTGDEDLYPLSPDARLNAVLAKSTEFALRSDPPRHGDRLELLGVPSTSRWRNCIGGGGGVLAADRGVVRVAEKRALSPYSLCPIVLFVAHRLLSAASLVWRILGRTLWRCLPCLRLITPFKKRHPNRLF